MAKKFVLMIWFFSQTDLDVHCTTVSEFFYFFFIFTTPETWCTWSDDQFLQISNLPVLSKLRCKLSLERDGILFRSITTWIPEVNSCAPKAPNVWYLHPTQKLGLAGQDFPTSALHSTQRRHLQFTFWDFFFEFPEISLLILWKNSNGNTAGDIWDFFFSEPRPRPPPTPPTEDIHPGIEWLFMGPCHWIQPTKALQPYANKVRKQSHSDSKVITRRLWIKHVVRSQVYEMDWRELAPGPF